MKKLLFTLGFTCIAALGFSQTTESSLQTTGNILVKEAVVIESNPVGQYDGKAVVGKVNVDHNPGVSARMVVVQVIQSGEILSGVVLGDFVSGEMVKVTVDRQKLDSILNLIR